MHEDGGGEGEHGHEAISGLYGAATAAAEWPRALELESCGDVEPPKSIMVGVPMGCATATFGHGGVGKSQIELMRAVCVAAGVPFCRLEVERRRVMFLSAKTERRSCTGGSIESAGI